MPDHLVFARKYRPQTFAEVVEQRTAVQALKNAIESDKTGSAYLFFGARGVGKTTLARIVAKRINCSNPKNGEPCNECDSCRSILIGNSMDVIEIDAASNRGIDDVRGIRENVKFPPMNSKKKVYIIDEVHMLSKEAFNALLKTLEEPPAHAVFVLATTELNKVPDTIASRCQVFTFRKLPLDILQRYLAELCKKEEIIADDESLFWIARKGDGSVRDSLSFMEQAVAYCGKKLEAAKVKELTGSVGQDLFLKLTNAMFEESAKQEDLVQPIHEYFLAGGDLLRWIWDYLEFLRSIVHIRSGVEDSEFLGIPGSDIAKRKEDSASWDSEKLRYLFQGIYQLLAKSLQLRLRNSYETRLLIEMELIDLRETLRKPSLSGLLKKLNHLSAAIQQGQKYNPEEELQNEFLGTIVEARPLP